MNELQPLKKTPSVFGCLQDFGPSRTRNDSVMNNFESIYVPLVELVLSNCFVRCGGVIYSWKMWLHDNNSVYMSSWAPCRSLEISRIPGADDPLAAGEFNSSDRNPTMVR